MGMKQTDFGLLVHCVLAETGHPRHVTLRGRVPSFRLRGGCGDEDKTTTKKDKVINPASIRIISQFFIRDETMMRHHVLPSGVGRK
jgi:hypothetical protein